MYFIINIEQGGSSVEFYQDRPSFLERAEELSGSDFLSMQEFYISGSIPDSGSLDLSDGKKVYVRGWFEDPTE